jgi:hypothetical protein
VSWLPRLRSAAWPAAVKRLSLQASKPASTSGKEQQCTNQVPMTGVLREQQKGAAQPACCLMHNAE